MIKDIMTIRLNKIKNREEELKKIAIRRQEQRKQEILDAEKNVQKLASRIKNLLILANACKEHNIIETEHLRTYNDDCRFGVTSYHNNIIGFYNFNLVNTEPVIAIGIKNKNLGNDLIIDETGTIQKNANYDNTEIYKYNLGTLEVFIEKFPEFEELFLNFIDQL